MKQLFIITCAILFLYQGFTEAQDRDFEAFKRERERDLRNFAAQRDSAMMLYNQRFRDYVETRNREYAEYLKNEWQNFRLFKSGEPFEAPKPETPPAFDTDQYELEGISVDRPVSLEPRIGPREVFREPIQFRPIEDRRRTTTINVDFFGRDFAIPADMAFLRIRPGGIMENDIADWFNQVSQTNYIPTLVAILEIAEEIHMNDWALYMLVEKLGAEISHNDHNNTVLYSWFLLQQAGYDIRIGRQANRLIPLMPFSDTVYNTPITHIDMKQFAAIGGDPEQQLFTYKQAMKGAYRSFDMSFYRSPRFAEQGNTRSLSFNYGTGVIKLELAYDPVLVKMLKEQPQSDAKVYFDSDASVSLITSADKSLPPLISEKNHHDAVSFLLWLTQNSFDYMTDSMQFGKQKFMFPDEVIHYAANDCDDRAVFFAWLVRNYAGKQVAAVQYPGHIATAVHFASGNPPGDSFTLDGKNFVIADPTYINAPIGKTMPDYAGVPPKVWLVDPGMIMHNQRIALWEQLFKYGARRGNNQQDTDLLPNGDILVTGYFDEYIDDGNIRVEGSANKRTAFVARINDEMRLLWVQTLQSDQNATGFALTLDQHGNALIAGSYEGVIHSGNHKITTNGDDADLFVAKYQTDGRLLWLQSAKLERNHRNNAMVFVCHYDLNGNHIETHYYNDPRETAFGLFVHEDYDFMLKGSFGRTSGLSIHEAPELASVERMDYTNLLIETNKEMIKNDVESSIAGLFAAIYLVKTEGVVFPGTAAQKAIQRENPRFSERFPITFGNIGKINFLMNKSGLIEIRTENGEDVFFDQLRIRDRSVIRVISLPNNDEKIEVVSRVSVGQYFVWYQLNFVRLYHQTGDLLFDYRRNNSQVKMNLRKDILN